MLHNFTLQIGFFFSYFKNYIAILKKKILILIVLIEFNFSAYVCIKLFFFNHQNLLLNTNQNHLKRKFGNLRALTWWA